MTERSKDDGRTTRRQFVVGIGAAAGGVVLAGCGGGASSGQEGRPTATGAVDDTDAVDAQASDTVARTDGAAVAFPVTVEHKYGATTIEKSPERIVLVGLNDQDAVLALGVKPIAVTADEYGLQYPYAVWPWAADKLGDAQPEVLPFLEIAFERIVALQPDLILGLYAGLTDTEYKLLSKIAPTVAQSGEYIDYGTPWDEMTRTAGVALGRSDLAEDLIAAVEAKFARAREEHPEFEDATAVYAGFIDLGQYYAESSQSSRVAILTSLGFELPAEIAELAGDAFYAEISQERLDLLDHDLLLWEIGDRDVRLLIEDNPLYRQLNVFKEGRDIFVEDKVLAGALAFASVLSVPYILDELVPQLAAAVDGVRSTAVQ